jgi:hypothetical protein
MRAAIQNLFGQQAGDMQGMLPDVPGVFGMQNMPQQPMQNGGFMGGFAPPPQIDAYGQQQGGLRQALMMMGRR